MKPIACLLRRHWWANTGNQGLSGLAVWAMQRCRRCGKQRIVPDNEYAKAADQERLERHWSRYWRSNDR